MTDEKKAQFKRPVAGSKRKAVIVSSGHAPAPASATAVAAVASAVPPAAAAAAVAGPAKDQKSGSGTARIVSVCKLTHDRRQLQDSSDGRAAERTAAAVARLKFEVPPLEDPNQNPDLLSRIFFGDTRARDALFDYICTVNVIAHRFFEVKPGKSTNPHSNMLKDLAEVHDILVPIYKDAVILNGLAVLSAIRPFREAIMKHCNPDDFEPFMNELWVCYEASLNASDVRDFGMPRVKNASPTFGKNLYEFVYAMRMLYDSGVILTISC
jgi:hypothetical protein